MEGIFYIAVRLGPDGKEFFDFRTLCRSELAAQYESAAYYEATSPVIRIAKVKVVEVS